MSESRSPQRRLRSATKTCAGFTYLALLVAIALISIGLMEASEVWYTTAQRQKMEQLEWIGNQYVQAIASYYNSGSGGVRSYPPQLVDLLQDPRYLNVHRHIRDLYANPFTNQMDWKILPAPGGGVMGIEATVDMPSGEVTRKYVYLPTITGLP